MLYHCLHEWTRTRYTWRVSPSCLATEVPSVFHVRKGKLGDFNIVILFWGGGHVLHVRMSEKNLQESLPLLCGSLGSNSGHQAWMEVPLPLSHLSYPWWLLEEFFFLFSRAQRYWGTVSMPSYLIRILWINKDILGFGPKSLSIELYLQNPDFWCVELGLLGPVTLVSNLWKVVPWLNVLTISPIETDQ